jgi:hypothetical protein
VRGKKLEIPVPENLPFDEIMRRAMSVKPPKKGVELKKREKKRKKPKVG